MKKTQILLTILLLIIASFQLVMSQSITVAVDKEIYRPGEVVNVYGWGPENTSIGILVINPEGKYVDFKMVKTDSMGKYSTTINLPLKIPYKDWIAGEYIVRAYAGSVVASTKFVLSLGAKVIGKVVDILGNPVSGAKVTVIDIDMSVNTDVDGMFVLYIAQGNYKIRISKEGYSVKEINVSVDKDEYDLGTITLEFLLPPQTITTTIVQTVTETITYTQTITETELTTIRETHTATETIYITTISTTSITTTDIKTIATYIPTTTTISTTLTATETILTTLKEREILTSHITETVTEQVTQWPITIALSIVLLGVGIGVGWFVRTLTLQKK
ncbi:MAG: carboxypeptidase regulatory-like domain-containing protein [Ignisphaera sp.]